MLAAVIISILEHTQPDDLNDGKEPDMHAMIHLSIKLYRQLSNLNLWSKHFITLNHKASLARITFQIRPVNRDFHYDLPLQFD